jgi:hypothetical protein
MLTCKHLVPFQNDSPIPHLGATCTRPPWRATWSLRGDLRRIWVTRGTGALDGPKRIDGAQSSRAATPARLRAGQGPARARAHGGGVRQSLGQGLGDF